MSTRLEQIREYRKALRTVLVSKTLDDAKNAARPLIEDHVDTNGLVDDEPVASDYEWLEQRGFSVEWDNDEGTGWFARIAVAGHIWVQVSEEYGSTALIWRESHDRELHFGIDDNATRGDVRRLCEALGKSLTSPE